MVEHQVSGHTDIDINDGFGKLVQGVSFGLLALLLFNFFSF